MYHLVIQKRFTHPEGCQRADSNFPIGAASKLARLLKNSLYARFDLRSGTKLAVFGAFQARFVVAVSSMPTFSTGSCVLTRRSFAMSFKYIAKLLACSLRGLKQPS